MKRYLEMSFISHMREGGREGGREEYIYVSVERRVESGERKIDYSVVIFLEKEPLKRGNQEDWDLNLAYNKQRRPQSRGICPPK